MTRPANRRMPQFVPVTRFGISSRTSKCFSNTHGKTGGEISSSRRDANCLCTLLALEGRLHGGRYGVSRVLGARLGETVCARHSDAVSLAASDSDASGAQQSASRLLRTDYHTQAASPLELGSIPFVTFPSVSLSRVAYRGEACLAAGRGEVLPPPSFRRSSTPHADTRVWNCWTGALAHLECGSCQRVHRRKPLTLTQERMPPA